jgi:uncharacterized repeat protein (TIGR01451 family)
MKPSFRLAQYILGCSIAFFALSNFFNVISSSSSPTSNSPADSSRTSESDSSDRLQVRAGQGGPVTPYSPYMSSKGPGSKLFAALATKASLVSPFVPTIMASKSNALTGDVNNNTLIDPGDTLTYTVLISNTGTDPALNVNFTDTIDPNTTFVPGTLIASPIAVNDTYQTIGNVNISVLAAQGILANDLNPNGPLGDLVITGNTTPANGALVLNADGSFTYTPNAGFRGPTDTFTYTLGNGTGLTDTATVTITINGMIWFVNNDDAAAGTPPGDGRLTNPFRLLTGVDSFNEDATDQAGDTIFIYTGDGPYTGGLTLLNNQKLAGQGAGATLLSISGLPAPSGINLLPATGGTNAEITAAVTNITTGSGNTIRGVTLKVTAAAAIALTGNAFGTLFIGETGIVANVGRALNLVNGTLTGPSSVANFNGGLASDQANGTAINLSQVAGAMTSLATGTSNTTGIGISVTGSTANFIFGNTAVSTSSGTGVVLGTSGNGNTGTIAFSQLNITPNSGARGLHAIDNTNTITATSGTITTTNAAAVDISKASAPVTPLALSLTTVNTTGGANGLRLVNTGGSFSVNGTGAANSGGTIQNCTTDGIIFNNSTNITLIDMRALNSTDNNMDATSVTTMTLTRFTSDASGNTGLRGTTVRNLTITNGLFEDSGIVANVHGIDITELLGTNSVTSSTFRRSATVQFKVRNTTRTSTNITDPPLDILTVSGCTFQLHTGPFNGDNLQYATESAANSRLIVNDSVGINNISDGIAGVQCNASSGSRLDVAISGVSRTGGTGTGINMNPTGANTRLTFNIFKNTLTNTGNIPINTTVIAAGATTANPAQIIGTIGSEVLASANTINGNVDGSGINIVAEGNAQVNSVIGTIAVLNNSITGIQNGGGIRAQARVGGTLNLDIRGNTVNINNALNLEGISVENGSSGAGDIVNNVCLNMANNKCTVGAASGQEDYRLAARNAPSASNNFLLQNFAGVGTSVADVTNWVTTTKNNKKADGVTNPTVQVSLLTGGSFGTSAGCTLPPPGMSVVADQVSTAAASTSEKQRSDEDGRSELDGKGFLVAQHGEGSNGDVVAKLSHNELVWMVRAAIERFRSAGVSADDLARLESMEFEIDDLPAGQLTAATSKIVRIDENGAGYGWFYDSFPHEDGEFNLPVVDRELQTTEGTAPFGQMDLLTAVSRALAYVLLEGETRIPERFGPVMDSTLAPGMRRLPLDQMNFNPATTTGSIPSLRESLQAASMTAIRRPSRIPTDARFAVFNPSADGRGDYRDLARRTSYAGAARPVSAASRAAALFSGETVTKAIGTIPNGESVTIKFQVSVDNPFPAGICTVTNPQAGSGANVTGSNFADVTLAPDVATVFKAVVIGACPANMTVNTDPGVCTAVVNFTTPTADGCPVPTVTCTPATGFAFPKGTTTVTCTASNGTPNPPNDTCSFTVTVNDNQPPVITCPAPITVPTGPGVCDAVVNFVVTATDNCGMVTPVCTPASGSTFAKGVTTVACEVTDSSSLTANCSFTVTVNDNEPPVVGPCPANVTVNNDPGLCSAIVNFTTPGATDNCPPVMPVVTCVPPSGAAFPTGTTTVVCSATDAMGNIGSCMFTVTVNDNEAPVVTCPASNGVFAASDCLPPANSAYTDAATVSYMGGTIDLSSLILFQFSACTPPPASTPGAMTTNSYTALFRGSLQIDPNPASPIQAPAAVQIKVTFNSSSGPTRTFDTEILQLDISGGNLSAGVMLRESPTLQSIGQTKITALTPTGFRIDSFFDVFTEISTDGGVNWSPASESSHLTAVQTTDPGVCTALVSYPPATATDNCPGVNTPICTPASGTTFAKGVTTVSCSTTDAVGNPGSCSFTVTVIDAQLPAITCPANITVDETSPGAGSAVVTYTTPTPADNCTPAPTVACIPPSGSSFPVGTTTTTCTATDSSGNTNSCSFLVTVNPLCFLTCNPNITTSTDPGLCTAVVMYAPPTVSGSCGTVTCSPASGSAFPKGVTTVTCTASVGPSCSFTVTVNDTEPPVLNNCPANITVPTDPDLCTAVVNYTPPTATDNCPGVGTPVCTPAPGFAFPKGVTTVTCTVSDAAGNPATPCSFTVTVNDEQPPSITCPANITQNVDPGQCAAVVTYTTPTATDNCPGVGAVTCMPASGATFPKGVTTVTCEVSDESKNTASCTFTVTINDNEPPTITCPANITVSTDPNLCSAVVNFVVTSSDNCPGSTLVSTPPSGSAFPKGTTTVTSTVTDTSGNTASCQFTVTVNDTQPPSIVCPSNLTVPAAPDACSAVVNYIVTAMDNCPGVTVVSSPPSGSTFPKGTTTVTATATDASGNTASCSFTVTVVDTQAPVITCPANITATPATPSDPCVTVNYPPPTATDNCPGVTVACVPPSGTCFPTGTTTVTCTATDASGNTASCSFSVIVFNVCLQDNSVPSRVVLANSLTGDYRFCCGATVFTGTGTVSVKGNIITIQHNSGNRRVLIKVDKSVKVGSASLQSPPGVMVCTITDTNITNNSCVCQ